MSTKTLLLKIAVIIFIFSILFSSCTIVTTSQINGTDIADLDVFIVQYKTDIGTAPKMRGIVKDANFKAEWVPELSQKGYKFLGWYFDDQKISAGHKCNCDMTLVASWEIENPNKMVTCLPKGSPQTFIPKKGGNIYSAVREQEITPFKIGAYDVTYKLWWEVKSWAVEHGYTFCHEGQDGENKSTSGKAPEGSQEYPATGMCFWDTIIWCNAYSEKSGLTPVYYSDEDYKSIYKQSSKSNKVSGVYVKSSEPKNVNTALCTANGYRLPSGAEWIWAALGGDPEKEEWTYKFSGSNDPKEVAVYGVSRMAVVGSKNSNSLGLFDMTGNARQTLFCFKNETPACYRVGGSYGVDDDSYITVNSRTWSGTDNPLSTYSWVTFRVAQSIR